MSDIVSRVRDIIDQEIENTLAKLKYLPEEEKEKWMKRAVTLAAIMARLPATEKGMKGYILTLEKSVKKLPSPYKDAILTVLEKITVVASRSYRERRCL